MERFIADLVRNFESGKVDRREFCKTVALAATVYAAGDAAQAQAPRGFKVIGVNHISYTCPDYRRAADWYSMVFNLDQVGATNRDVALPFGKKGEKPLGITANDVPLTHIICRTRPQESVTRASTRPTRGRRSGAAPRPASMRASRGCGRTWWRAAGRSGSTTIRCCRRRLAISSARCRSMRSIAPSTRSSAR